MAKNKIKPPAQNSGSKIKPNETIDYNSRPPIFSLEKIVNGDYCFSSLDQAAKAAFAESIFKRRNVTWNQLFNIDRHKLGTEKLPIDSLNVPKPLFLTDDVEHVIAFRFHGLCPMVGYRQKDVFFILWFDHNFTLYDH